MKIAAWIIAVFGILNFLALPMGLIGSHVAAWPRLLADSILGAFLILIAIGIWKRNISAWRFGFLVIAFCASYSAVCVWDKTIPMIFCLVGHVVVVAYWSVVWYRQKKWFETEIV